MAFVLLAVPSRLMPTPMLELEVCHATSRRELPPVEARTAEYSCTGTPENYSSQWLWLRHTLDAKQQAWPDWALAIRSTRFETLKVHFHYVDGSIDSHEVRNGDFKSYWHPNGYIVFTAARRPAPLVEITIGLDRLAAYEVLVMKLATTSRMGLIISMTTLCIGATMSLLAASFLYNVLLAIASRHRALYWHAAWLACMCLWGTVWTQLILLVAPGLAGVATVRLIALLATLAVILASLFMFASFERGVLPRWFTITYRCAILSCLALSFAWSYAPAGTASRLASFFTLSTLAVLGLVVAALIMGVLKGSEAAKDFALSWIMPVLAVVSSYQTAIKLTNDIMSEQLLVMIAGALQALWLSYIATRAIAKLRTERDQARARQDELMILAETDPLTRLYNRRGFTERFRQELAAKTAGCVGLMLIDLDHFKLINDTYGHEVGDHVLQRIAGLLGELRKEGGIAARLGGEEFCVILPGYSGSQLHAVAERTRARLEEADMSSIFGTTERRITASIGVADTDRFPAADAAMLLRLADQALYRAKAAGRNRVIAASEDTVTAPGSRRREAWEAERA